MTQYNESIVVKMADNLYSQARSIEVSWAFLGLLAGGAAGAAGAGFVGLADQALCLAAAAALLGVVLGFMVGRSRAFLLRLQAQTALCQVQIERNTRAPKVPAPTGD